MLIYFNKWIRKWWWQNKKTVKRFQVNIRLLSSKFPKFRALFSFFVKIQHITYQKFYIIIDPFIFIPKYYFKIHTADQSYRALGTPVSPKLHFMSVVRILKLKIQVKILQWRIKVPQLSKFPVSVTFGP